MSNSLGPDQEQRFVAPDLGPTICKGYQQMTEAATSKERVIGRTNYYKIMIFLVCWARGNKKPFGHNHTSVCKDRNMIVVKIKKFFVQTVCTDMKDSVLLQET